MPTGKRELEFAYRAGTISRGRFKRVAKAQGWTPAEMQEFERQNKQQHKKAREGVRNADTV